MSNRATKIAQWSSRFERFQKSNISVTEFCHQERVTVQAFYYWRNRVPMSTGRPSGRSPTIPNPLRIDSSILSGEHVEAMNERPVVRFTLRSGETTIQCESSSLQAIELLLKWAANSAKAPSSVFEQLV